VLEFRVVGFRDVRNIARQLARDARVDGFAHRTSNDAITVRSVPSTRSTCWHSRRPPLARSGAWASTHER
jgi:hypothetical protein